MDAMDKVMLEDLHRKNGLVFKATIAISLLSMLAIVGSIVRPLPSILSSHNRGAHVRSAHNGRTSSAVPPS